MTSVSLRFANDLLRRLGEELTPSPVNGVIEMVKNAYDADAPRCDVTLTQPVMVEGALVSPGTLRIEDWGDGMSRQDLRDGWLILGRSRKRHDQVTRLGRHPAGDKGLGRLAAMRMGSKVTVVTRPRSSPGREYSLEIDWPRFEKKVTPDEVALEIKSRRIASSIPSGTVIEISGIQRRIEASDIDRLHRGLQLIANPFEAPESQFVVNFLIEPPLRRPLPTSDSLFKACAFRLEASVDSSRQMQAQLFDAEGKTLSTANHAELLPRFKDAEIEALPPVRFQLWIYILREKEFEGGGKELKTVRAWLREFGGIHVFVDGVRVAPYGDPNDDWVGINALRAASPELTPTTRTAIGFVAASHHPDLKQKTDRSGFIERPSVSAIREFVRATIRWQQAFRVSLRDTIEDSQEKQRLARTTAIVGELSDLFSGLTDQPRAKAMGLLTQLGEISERREAALKRELELYRTLGTAGIAASVFAHEATHNSLARIQDGVKSIGFKVKRDNPGLYRESVASIVNRVVQDVEGLSSVANITLSLIRARKRRAQKIGLAECVAGIVNVFSPYFNFHKVAVDVIAPESSLSIHGSRAALECAVVNLITNALQAFERSEVDEPRIVIRIDRTSRGGQIDIADNGPGIQDIALGDIWLPGETTREDGTGLGLAIVKAAVRDLGGTVSARARSELGGAEFTLVFPVLS